MSAAAKALAALKRGNDQTERQAEKTTKAITRRLRYADAALKMDTLISKPFTFFVQ